MNAAILAVTAIKMMFERERSEITKLGINAELLKQVLSGLIRDYVSNNEFGLAADAAQITDDTQDYRFVLDAMMKASDKPRTTGMAAFFESLSLEQDFLQLMIRAGTEAEQRGYLTHCRPEHTIAVLIHLKDVDGLLAYGKQKTDEYVSQKEEERRKQSSMSNTGSLLRNASDAYEAALKLGSPEASTELIRLADRLLEYFGVEHSCWGWDSGDRRERPELYMYTLANTPEATRKAAEYCRKVSEGNEAKRRSEYAESWLSKACGFYAKLNALDEVQPAVVTLANKFAEEGDLLKALTLYGLAGMKLDEQGLKPLMASTMRKADAEAKDALRKYLESHIKDIPFPTDYTFWWFSDSCSEWNEYYSTVISLAGRFDFRRGYCGNEVEAKAKHFYATDKREVIEQVCLGLERHLIVGWMLSAVSFQDRHGVCGNSRKYPHAAYAAWRSFHNAVENGGYNPFNRDIKLMEYKPIGELYEYLRAFVDEWFKLQSKKEDSGYHEDTYESNRFIRAKLPEVKQRIQAVYQTITEEVKVLIEQL